MCILVGFFSRIFNRDFMLFLGIEIRNGLNCLTPDTP